MKHGIYRNIRTPEDLGNAHLGNPNTAIVPPKRRIDRADYGRRLAEAEGGIFTPSGYFVPIKNKGGNLMQNKYTRQRQGRDFFNHLASAEMSVEGNYNNIDGIIGNAPPKDDSDERHDFLTRMERFKEEAERNAVPIDGHEPVTERIR